MVLQFTHMYLLQGMQGRKVQAKWSFEFQQCQNFEFVKLHMFMSTITKQMDVIVLKTQSMI